MAKKSSNTPTQKSPPAHLLISRQEAKSRIEERKTKGLEIRRANLGNRQDYETVKVTFHKWDHFNLEMLKRIFSSEEFSKEYDWAGSAGQIISMFGDIPSLGEDIHELHKSIEAKIQSLESISERLELIPEGSDNTVRSASLDEEKTKSSKVFIVHGHDEISKTNLEVILRDMGLEPIVLHRQADEGQTIIEKFEKHSDVGYAFILLTPDEIAYLKSEESKPDAERKKENRARPNVIFEFGYFVGKLGRSKVCCLYTGGVTLPSDVSGMIYKKYETSVEEVAYAIIKDLKASGYKIT